MHPSGGHQNSGKNIVYILIAVNVLVFILLSSGGGGRRLVYEFALSSYGIKQFKIWQFVTYMFMHAGFLHLAGNMLYLWIFGDNVEDALGRVKYLVFYLVGGVVAALAHVLFNPNSQIPTVGASGAIGAVLGAYLILFPQSRVLTFIPIGFFLRLQLVPAAIVLGVWFILQLFSGVASLGGSDVAGTAFWAHIGGFVSGMLMAKLFAPKRRKQNYANW